MEIREATRDDLPALLALYRQLESQQPPITLERLTSVFERLTSYPNYRVFLATKHGEALGTFAVMIMDTLGDRCAPAGIVEDVVVDRSHRGGGIGRAMMESAMARCRQAGCYKMVLSSNIAREDAHRFYESLGFEKHGYSFKVDMR